MSEALFNLYLGVSQAVTNMTKIERSAAQNFGPLSHVGLQILSSWQPHINTEQSEEGYNNYIK